MTLEEAKIILINRGFVEINGDLVFDGNKWRNSIAVISKWLEQQPIGDCISRQAVDTLVDELARAISDERCCMSRGRSTATIMQDILDLPSVTPKEKTGKWIDITNKNGTVIAVRCNCCENSPKHAIRSDFCPNCGARMVEPQESEG